MARGGPTFKRIIIQDGLDLRDGELQHDNDGTYASAQTWSGVWYYNSGLGTSSQTLPAASATAWAVWDIGGTDYYTPLFNTYW